MLEPQPGADAPDRYESRGSWSYTWWLPDDLPEGEAVPLGTQVCVPARGGLPPHLAFVPYKQPPDGGHPVLVFLHGSGESAPTPLRRVALQGPPQTAGRDPASLDFAVLSPQKPAGREFADDEIARGVVKLVDAYVASHRIDASRVYLTHPPS